MSRRTKIIATIGPSCESEGMIKDLALAGMDVARINLSHGSLDLGIERYRRVRVAEAAVGRPIGILVDLPGPKGRTGQMPEGGLAVADGSTTPLRPGHGASTAAMIHVDH